MAQRRKPKSFWQAIAAGGGAGAIEAVIMFPTEFVKTQLQLQSKTNPIYKGPIDCVRLTIQQHGPFGMYRGLSTLIVGSVPKAAVRFTAFEQLKRRMVDKDGNLSTGRTFLCGLGAGMSEAVFAVTPMETVKTKFIHDLNQPKDSRKYKGLVHGVSTIVKTEGIGGIYKGLGPTILKQGSNQAVRFVVYNKLKEAVSGPNQEFGMIKSAMCGAAAGSVSVMCNNPIDVVKTKMQGLESGQYKNSWDCATSVLKKEGPFGFYRGVTPRILRVSGDAAIVFTIYDKLMQLIQYMSEK